MLASYSHYKGLFLLTVDFEMQFALPHIMGWAHSTNRLPDSAGLDSSKVRQQLGSASEWDR